MFYVVAVMLSVIGMVLVYTGSIGEIDWMLVVGWAVVAASGILVISAGAARHTSEAEAACVARGGSPTTIHGQVACFAVGAVLGQPEPAKPR